MSPTLHAARDVAHSSTPAASRLAFDPPPGAADSTCPPHPVTVIMRSTAMNEIPPAATLLVWPIHPVDVMQGTYPPIRVNLRTNPPSVRSLQRLPQQPPLTLVARTARIERSPGIIHFKRICIEKSTAVLARHPFAAILTCSSADSSPDISDAYAHLRPKPGMSSPTRSNARSRIRRAAQTVTNLDRHG